MNFPVNKTDFVVSKNVKNPLSIFVRDIDRKPVILTDTPILHVTDRKTRRVLLTKELTLVDPIKARYDALLGPDDLRDLDVAVYSYLVTLRATDGSESLLYTDRDRAELSYIEVREGPLPPPVDPDVILADDMVVRSNSFATDSIDRYTGSFPGAASVGNQSSIQSFAVYANRFTGSVTVQGSLDVGTTTDDTQWFDVETHPFDGVTGIVGFSFLANLVWVRFKITQLVLIDTGDANCACQDAGEPVDYNRLVWPSDEPIGVRKIIFRS